MLERLDTRDVSLDSQLFDGSNSRLLDTLVSDAADQEVSLADDEARLGRAEAVRSAIVKLDARERFIVESRMMADRDDELSLAEIGRRLGVSRERARQLEARAKGKLRALLGRDLPEKDDASTADLDTEALSREALSREALSREALSHENVPGGSRADNDAPSGRRDPVSVTRRCA